MTLKTDIDLVAHGAPALANNLVYRVEHFGLGLLRVSIRANHWFGSRLVKGTEIMVHPAEVASGIPAVVKAVTEAHAVLKAIEGARDLAGDRAAPEPSTAVTPQ